MEKLDEVGSLKELSEKIVNNIEKIHPIEAPSNDLANILKISGPTFKGRTNYECFCSGFPGKWDSPCSCGYND